MPLLTDTIGRVAAEDVDELSGAEGLVALPLQAHDRRHQLLRRHRSVERLRWLQARVAVAAGSGLLPEVAEQVLAAASDRLAQREHGVEVLPQPGLERAIAGTLVDEPPLLHDISEAVRHPGQRRLAVAARAARLLVVPLDRLRQIDVRDEPDIGLVDAHAERDRRDHHDAVVAQEPGLIGRAHRRVEPRVVRQRVDALRAQILRRLLDGLAAERIDDAGGTSGCASRTPG